MGNLINLKTNINNKRSSITLSDLFGYKTHQSTEVVDLSSIDNERFREEIYEFLSYNSKRKNLKTDGFIISYYNVLRKLINSGKIDNISKLSDLSLNHFKEVHSDKISNRIIRSIDRYINERDNRAKGFEANIWYLDEFNIADKRNNLARKKRFFNFQGINSKENEKHIKEYIKHLLTNSDLSMGTINAKIRRLKNIMNIFEVENLQAITEHDVKIGFIKLGKGITSTVYNSTLYDCFSLFQYLLIHKKIEFNPINIDILQKQGSYNYKITKVDDYVSNQIFSKLDQVKEPFNIIYLLIFCVGMRVSEVCLLKVNSLEKTNKNYFIRFFNHKMQKYVSNVIPENLYVIIKSYISKLDSSSEYLFCREGRVDKPMHANSIGSRLSKEFKRLNIKTLDGKYFRFRAHDYRHTLAAKMLRVDIPFQYIQKQLHHQSPEMTFVYVEYDNLRKIEKIDSFVNIAGEKVDLLNEDMLEKDLRKAEWVREYINAQMLPNGVCARPIKLGNCPHCNSCLTCKDFKTSIEFLPQHKNQLKNINTFIETAEENGWIPQIETNMKTKNNLEKIIKVLEKW